MSRKQLTMLDHALKYAAAGLPVIPLHSILEDGSCTCNNDKCSSPGKHPRTKNGMKAATTDKKKIESWWGENRWPNASIGGVGGEFLCLDIDAKSGGPRSLQRLVASNAPLPATAVVETGEYEIDGEHIRGQHYWFRMPEDTRVSSRAGVRDGIDIRCHNGYAVMPPSPHASGVCYEWLSGSISEADEVPEWVLDLAPDVVEGDSSWEPDPHFKMSKDVREFLRGNLEVPTGEQRQFLTRAARSVLTTGKSIERSAELLWEGFNGDGGICSSDWDEDPWTEQEVTAIVEDIFSKGPSSAMEKDFTDGAPMEILETDVGNAKRLVESYPEGHAFWVSEWGKWYTWNDDKQRFFEDNGRRVRKKFMDEVTHEMMREAAERRSEEEMKRLFAHAVKSQNRPRIEAAAWAAQHLVPTRSEELNADPMLFAVKNGVLDLSTGELLEPSPEYKITKRSNVEYVEGAKSKVWDQFLRTVVPDKEVREFLQRAFGYTLTGKIDEHKFFYLHGPPASGKSTLLETFAYLMGNYSEAADPSTFMSNPNKMGSGPTDDLARLANARMVVTHELEKGSRWADAHMARLTGGDTIVARFMYQQAFEFRPKFKLWFSANNKPKIASTNSGMWRRILVVPMEHTIPQEDRNPMLPEKLRSPEVQSAVLAWALEGLARWREHRGEEREMEVPEIVREEVEEYQREEDELGGFIDEHVRVLEGRPMPKPEDRVSVKLMFETYLGWCAKEARNHTMTQTKFTREMKSRGFRTQQMSVDGQRPDGWLGLTLKGRIRTPKDRR